MRKVFVNVRKRRIKFLILAGVLVSIIVGSTVYLPQPEQRNHQYNFLLAWGSQGFGLGQFNYPAGVAVDSSGNVYVIDSGYSRVEKFTGSGSFITAWRSSGFGLSVAVDSSGNVYVTGGGGNGVKKFDGYGRDLTQWGFLWFW
jgi:DNA-binding beta-propeller fold protein YncE